MIFKISIVEQFEIKSERIPDFKIDLVEKF